MAEDRTLLQSQKNKVAGLVTAAGLAPSAFEWLRMGGRNYLTVSRLEHKESGFYYEFGYFTNQYEGEQPLATYSPGDNDREVQHALSVWDEHAEQLVDWLVSLRRELHAPDLWSASEALASDLADIARNEPFSREDQELIANELAAIRRRIDETYKLTDSQGEIVAARLEYLAAASARVGRFDWRGLVVSVIYGIIWDLAFNPTQARQLAGFFIDALGAIVQSLPRLPH